MIEFDTTFLDYPDAESFAIIVYMSGCEHHCVGCQNPDLQKIHDLFSNDYIEDIIEKLKNLCQRNETNKIVLSGGDPLHPCNRFLTQEICRSLGEELKYNICVYTGYDIDSVKSFGLHGFTYIKSGKFDVNNKRESEKTNEYIKFVNATQNLFDANFNQVSSEGVFYFKN